MTFTGAGAPRRIALATGFVWALVYFWLATPRLTAQGLYYDELHQATGAFAYVDASKAAGAYVIEGIPVLNMPYSGAIKTGIYGMWLKASGHPFSVLSWRLLGCLFAAFGIFAACSMVAGRMGLLSAHVFGFLISSDMTLVLATRHDWGPVALALMLRLLLIAVWLREWNSDRPSIGGASLMGLLLGLAVFEKLSSIVVALPVAAAFLLDSRRRNLRQIVALAGGGLMGSLPLILINLHSWREHHVLVSLATEVTRDKAFPHAWRFLETYAGLGNGGTLSPWILGRELPGLIPRIEGRVILFMCLVLAAGAALARSSEWRARAAGVAAALYVAVGLCIEALPAPTWTHHWVLGTPMQYLAIVLGLDAIRGRSRDSGPSRILRWSLVPTLAVLVAVRLPAVVAIERFISAGLSSETFDVEISQVGTFAGRQSPDSVVIATSWGVASQILCLSNARIPVREPYWGYAGSGDLRNLIADRSSFFLVDWKSRVPHPEKSDRILADARALPGFRELPVPEASDWRRVRVWRFDRIR